MSALPPALVLLNPAARGGRGCELWAKVTEAVRAHIEPKLVLLDGGWQAEVHAALHQGVRVFVAAGGDGTVNAILNALVRAPRRPDLCQLTLGAVGLGSSNDFHKSRAPSLQSVPLKIDPRNARRRDVCVARFRPTANGDWQQHYFLVSASMGVTAQANVFFNEHQAWFAWLKRRSVFAAIGVAALYALATYQRMGVTIRVEGATRHAQLNSLNVMKTPYISGTLHVDTPAAPDDGLLGVNLCSNMSRVQMLGALSSLARGRFQGRPGCEHWHARAVHLQTGCPASLELDGEVFSATEVSLGVIPEWIGECQ